MAGIEQLVDDLERSYRETQERMSDPAVYNDHREAAEGRAAAEKELEEPHRLAVEMAGRHTDLRVGPRRQGTSGSSFPSWSNGERARGGS
jgi:hypothetical protein